MKKILKAFLQKEIHLVKYTDDSPVTKEKYHIIYPTGKENNIWFASEKKKV